ncbi:MAG: HAD family hydrolase [Nostoc sp. ChiSLP02]|nr:HAD family hydrolase [Nostoc sp. ChiSLP02]
MDLLTESEQSTLNFKYQDIKAVIFDVDGTLYSLKKMYRIMRLEMLKYYLKHPLHLPEVKIVTNFINEREKNVLNIVDDLENAQYEWAAEVSGVSIEQVRKLVQKWIFQEPLKHIYSCRHPEVLELFKNVANRGLATAVFSDYPARDKLSQLGLSPNCIVSSTDKNVGRLKPDPKGLLLVAETLGIAVENCLFIGDRDDRDGECARRAGMPYLILEKGKNTQTVKPNLLSNLFCEIEDNDKQIPVQS